MCKLDPMRCYGYMPPDDVDKEYYEEWRKGLGIDELMSCWETGDNKNENNCN